MTQISNSYVNIATRGWLIVIGTILTVCASPSMAQNSDTRVTPRHLVGWIKEADTDKGFFQSIKEKVGKVTDMVVRVTSPAVAPERRRLWIVSVDGSRNILLSPEVGVRNPRWGRLGYIAYEVETDTNNDGTIDMDDEIIIRVIPADGGQSRTLGVGHSPIWSPDGRHIAFLRDNQIWVYTLGGDTSKIGNVRLDGQIVMTNRRSVALAEEFWAIALSDLSLHKLPEDVKSRYLWLGAISRTGSHLVFHDAMRSDIFVRKLSGKAAERNVTSDAYLDMDPAWSPDEKCIVYVSDRPESAEN